MLLGSRVFIVDAPIGSNVNRYIIMAEKVGGT